MGALSFNPTGELLLWGNKLYDYRAPKEIHAFDTFAGSRCSGTIHPNNLEVILNTEVRYILHTLSVTAVYPRPPSPMPAFAGKCNSFMCP